MKNLIKSLLFLIAITFSMGSVAFCVHNKTDREVTVVPLGCPKFLGFGWCFWPNGRTLDSSSYTCCPSGKKRCQAKKLKVYSSPSRRGSDDICSIDIDSKHLEVYVVGNKSTVYKCQYTP